MLTTLYSTVLAETARLVGLDYSSLTTEQFGVLRGFHSRRLRDIWGACFWHELTLIERRFFRDLFSAAASSYAAGVELYDAASGKYVTAVRAITDPSAAAQQPTDSNEDVQTAYWAELKREYGAGDYSSAQAYVAGDVVTYRDALYSCHTASTGNAPTDTNYWGEVQEFERYVDWEQTGATVIGTVAGVWDRNPRVYRNAVELDWQMGSNGIVVGNSVHQCYVEFRKRCPELTGDAFSATTTYAAGEQMYYTDGSFYDCATATSAGEDPDDTPAKWTEVELPREFSPYLVNGAAADWQRGQDKDVMNADRHERMAQAALERSMTTEGSYTGPAKMRVLTR